MGDTPKGEKQILPLLKNFWSLNLCQALKSRGDSFSSCLSFLEGGGGEDWRGGKEDLKWKNKTKKKAAVELHVQMLQRKAKTR